MEVFVYACVFVYAACALIDVSYICVYAYYITIYAHTYVHDTCANARMGVYIYICIYIYREREGERERERERDVGPFWAHCAPSGPHPGEGVSKYIDT